MNKFESHSPKDALNEVWLKLTQWSKKNLNFVNVFFAISLLSPGGDLPLNKLEECFVTSLVEISPMFLERIFKFRQNIFTLSLSSPLGKGVVLYSPLSQRCDEPSLVESGPVVSRRRNCEKFTTTTTTDNRQFLGSSELNIHESRPRDR